MHIAVHVTEHQVDDNSTNHLLAGVAYLSETNTVIEWVAAPALSALAATVNAAIMNAAIAAAEEAEYEVGLLDKKTLFGGAIGL